jgi:hypothetical protein
MTADTSPEEPAGLTLGDFEGRIGSVFAVDTTLGAQELVLESIQALPQSARPEGGFRVEFSGPAQPRLPQSIYDFSIGGNQHAIFIVAIGQRADGRLLYEAVFF